MMDEKFGITDKVVKYIESAQQEFVWEARKIETGVWDLGSMYADKMLNKGMEFIGNQVVEYLRLSINDVTPRMY